MKINLSNGSLATWIVCTAIKDDFNLMDQMDFSQNGVHEIKFTVDGVELNFINVINRIDEIYGTAVEKAAGRMYLEKFDKRSDEITEELGKIADRLKEIRITKFPEIDWEDD